MMKMLTVILVAMLILGCSITDATYQPEGFNESDLIAVSGSGPSPLQLDPEKGAREGVPYWVSISYVYDREGVAIIEPNSWSGSYENVHLPEGTYLIKGSCWRGNMCSPYMYVLDLERGRQYQLRCSVNDLEKARFWSNDYTGKVTVYIEDTPLDAHPR